MANRDIVVVGASAGGLEALRWLASGLREDFPAAICVAQHVPAAPVSLLPAILDRSGPLPAAFAKDGERYERGRIYVAPSDRHLLLEGDGLRVRLGPRQNRHRPAIDPLFVSAARAQGPRVIGVILSGALDDGSAGLREIQRRGGIAVVQDPSDALVDGMPRNALKRMEVDHCLPVREIPALLERLARETVLAIPPGAQEEIRMEGGVPLRPTSFGCPSCGGVLWEADESFRCPVGHSFAAESLLAEQDFRLEDSLWVAIRTLEEKAALKRRMATRFREQHFAVKLVENAEDDAALADFHAQRLRDVIEQVGGSEGR